ncbi:hypothetical protein [Actinomadura sp. GTD37]|uniref:hypothetical protein n=1 Tax=Actinomadura sp. GTD37 TaxID=1778030 RepID=UPI0035C19EF6
MRFSTPSVKAQGGAEALSDILDSYGFVVDDTLQKRITACRDFDQILAWIGRTPKAQPLGEIFT